MLYWIIKTTLLSFILIFLVHHLFNFFKSTLTVPKIKDLVNSPTQKYENMYNIISKQNKEEYEEEKEKEKEKEKEEDFKIEYTNDNLFQKPDTELMKNELKNFLKNQTNNSSTNISDLDAYSSSDMNSYATI
jgi:hypothetical protein